MNGNKSILKFSEIFSNNAGEILSTITSQNISLNPSEQSKFYLDKIKNDLELPLVMLHISFSGDQSFLIQMLLSKKTTAKLADLMMLGDGNVDYIPDEHNEAAQEMFNQVLGSITSELSAEGISLSGSLSNVELTDMELQQQIMEDSILTRLEVNISESKEYLYFVFDTEAEKSMEKIFASKTKPSTEKTQAKPVEPAANKEDAEPVPISKASFSDLDTRSTPPKSDINLDILMDVVLPITVELGRKEMKIKEILELGQGSVVELDKLAGDLVDIMVNGKKFAVGEVMVADENYAVRIISLLSREERIKSLGKN